MDRKTLEHMAERVDKAREIIRKIEELNEFIANLKSRPMIRVQFLDENGIVWAESNYAHLVGNIENVSIEIARRAIAYLEDELAEI